MSNFLEKLKTKLQYCIQGDRRVNETIVIEYERDNAVKMIDSLGDNARRMLEIGLMQDELAKLGFYHHDGCGVTICEMTIQPKSYDYLDGHRVRVYFGINGAGVHAYNFKYEDQNWQEDLINRVKELIK